MLSVIFLAALIRLNLNTSNPLIPALINAGLPFILALFFAIPLEALLIGAAIDLCVGIPYFWLLKRTEDSATWWLIAIGGIALVAFIGM